MLADAWKQWNGMSLARQAAVRAALLAWALVAFDYFLVLVFAGQIAEDFYTRDHAAYAGFFNEFLNGDFRWLSSYPIAPSFSGVDLTPILFIAICVTIATRWIGALVFGPIADHCSKRVGLIVVILYFSAIESVTAFSPNLTAFLIMRALFGLGMGGEWGIGASLAMESLPKEEEALGKASRGLFSGIIQQGYPLGNLCAALAALVIALFAGRAGIPPSIWRQVFLVSGVLGFILLLPICLGISGNSPTKKERIGDAQTQPAKPSQTLQGIGIWMCKAWDGMKRAWQTHPETDVDDYHWKSFVVRGFYAVVLVFLFTCMSHASQDLYPTFLASQVGLANRLTPDNDRLFIIMIYAFSAFLGSFVFGYRSTKRGRTTRQGRIVGQTQGRLDVIVIAAVFGLLVIPLWSGIFPLGLAILQQPSAFGEKPALFPLPPSPSIVLLIIGAFLMQFVVQGAYGVLPASLAKLASHKGSDKVSATHLGFAYGAGASLTCWIPLAMTWVAYQFPGYGLSVGKMITLAAPIPNYAVAQAFILAPAFVLVIIWVTGARRLMRTKSKDQSLAEPAAAVLRGMDGVLGRVRP